MKILKKELALKGLSVEKLSKRIDITEQALHSLIRGDSKPRASTTKKLIDFGFSETASLNPAKDIEV